jgi:hypothetical protein
MNKARTESIATARPTARSVVRLDPNSLNAAAVR